VSLIIGCDGAPGARAAEQAVAGRTWSPGSLAHLVTVIDSRMLFASASPEVSAAQVDEVLRLQRESALSMAAWATRRLSKAGLATRTAVRFGEPKSVLLQEAKRRAVDCIVVGATGLTRFERLLMGSVSSAVAMRATCAVEIIRPTTARAAAARSKRLAQERRGV
jgi:nucleotide-binding universal stress UspA family protein